MGLSHSRIDALGRRLRGEGQPASDDVELLDGYLLEFAAPLEAVAATLKDRLAM